MTPTATTPAWAHGTVLVTGASSGIGAALAREAAATASTLVLVARRRERLDELAATLTALDRPGLPPLVVDVRPADLADAAAVEALATAVTEAHGGVDVLVNNAGFGEYGLVEDTDPARLAQMIAVNVTAPTLLARYLLPGMVARGRGAVLMVGSIAGRMPTPGAAVYAATKFYVNGLSEGLRGELDGTGVVLTELAPGPVSTEFDEVSGMGPLTDAVGVVRIDADRCAREGWAGLLAGRAVVQPGAVLRAAMAASVPLPRPVLRRALALVGRRQRG